MQMGGAEDRAQFVSNNMDEVKVNRDTTSKGMTRNHVFSTC